MIGLIHQNRVLIAVICMSAVSVAAFLVATQIIGEMVAGHGLGNDQAGYIIAFELGGMAIAAVPAYFWIERCSTQMTVKVALVLSVLANAVTAVHVSGEIDYASMLVLRLLAGLPSGSIMIVCIRSIAQLDNVERGYALHTLGQILFAVIGLALLPFLFENWGLYAAYTLFALLSLLLIPLASFFVQIHAQVYSDRHIEMEGRHSNFAWCLLGMFGIFLFYTALSGLWSYVEGIGVASGLHRDVLGVVLSATASLGILGSIVASLMGGRVSGFWASTIGMILMTLSVALFFDQPSMVRFVAAAAIAKFTWTFVIAFLLGGISAIDTTKRFTTNIFLVISVGLAVGPALSAFVIGDTSNFDRIVFLSFGMILFCTVVMSLFTFVSEKIVRTQDTRVIMQTSKYSGSNVDAR